MVAGLTHNVWVGPFQNTMVLFMAVKLLKCPRFVVSTRQLDTAATLRKIERLNNLISRHGPAYSFGFEIKLSHYLYSVKPNPDHASRELTQKLFLRPAVEPLLYRYKEVHPDGFNHALINQMVSLYYGALSRVRDTEAKSWTDESGNYVQFPPAENAMGYIDRIRTSLDTTVDPIQASAYVVAETILSHPYPDGNGRLGRLLGLICLARFCGHSFLPVPLGPVILANYDRYILWLNSLSETGDWTSFVATYDAFINEALDALFEMLGTNGTVS